MAEAIWPTVQAGAAKFEQRRGRPPTLAVIGSGDAAAVAYGRQIERQFNRHSLRVLLSAPDAAELIQHVRGLSADPLVDGVLLLTPLSDGVDAESAVAAIGPVKDVDGQHPLNLGRLAQRRRACVPATALGGLRLLQYYGVELTGKHAVVVGRSPVVGMPLALLLIDADAVVTVCHSRAGELKQFTRAADILCVSAGREGLIGPDHVRAGTVVLDFGTNATPEGALVGDVQTDAVREIVEAITPVPGGTGPTTVAVLAERTLRAAGVVASAV